jgi:SAM-dependent methyltransferase
MKADVKQRMPRLLRDAVRHGRYVLLDALDFRDKLLDRRDPLRPPRRLIIEVGGLYEETGQRFLRIFKDVVGLKSTDHVLEIGCGVGRIALPLARYLGPAARYEGLDIVRVPVRWCQEHITPRYPAFRFVHADIYNSSYNREGRIQARDYVFPYSERAFDFVWGFRVLSG